MKDICIKTPVSLSGTHMLSCWQWKCTVEQLICHRSQLLWYIDLKNAIQGLQLSIVGSKLFLLQSSWSSRNLWHIYCSTAHLSRERKDSTFSAYVFHGHCVGLSLQQNWPKFTRAQNFVKSSERYPTVTEFEKVIMQLD